MPAAIVPAMKIDYYFQGPYQGWKETWYTLDGTTQNALKSANNVAPARAAILGKGNYIVGILATDLTTPGSTSWAEVYYGRLAPRATPTPLISRGSRRSVAARSD